MIELWGAKTCESCYEAIEYLQKTPIEFKYIDVAMTDFEGAIPRIVDEDGRHIIGLPAIKNYVQQWLKQMGML